MAKKPKLSSAFELKAIRLLPGAIYGLMQPTVLAILKPGQAIFGIEADLETQVQDLVRGMVSDIDPLPDNGIQKPPLRHVRCELRFAQLIADLAVALQLRIGQPVSRGRALPDQAAGTVHVAVPYFHRVAGDAAMRSAVDLVNACLSTLKENAGQSNLAREQMADGIKLYREKHAGTAPIATAAPFIRLAQHRNIPWYELPGAILQLGQGARSQRLSGTFTSRTSNIASRIARQKPLGTAILRMAGLPVPQHLNVKSKKKALEAAEQLGYPVVIKPADQDGGIGVYAGLMTPDAVSAAYDKTKKSAESVLVESHVEGHDYRLLVVNGRMISAIHRQPGGVLGDGQHTIKELVDSFNEDPRRGAGKDNLVPLELDEEALEKIAEAGYEPGSVVPDGKFVSFRRRASLHTGGTPTSVTEIIHPDNRRLAERACRIVGLDIAGVDFLCPDISRSWRDVGGAICEVNGQPVLRGHWFGDPDVPVNEIIMDYLFPDQRARIPVITVTGHRSVQAICAMLQAILTNVGMTVGLATPEGAWIGSEAICSSGAGDFRSARALLIDPATQAVVLHLTDETVVRDGFPYDVCAVAGIAGHGANTDSDGADKHLTPVCRAILERARRATIICADNQIEWPVPGIPARTAILVSTSKDNEFVASHVFKGGRAVVVKPVDGRDAICQLTRAGVRRLINCDAVQAANSINPDDLSYGAAFASALAWGLGIKPDHVVAGLTGGAPVHRSDDSPR